ncbi:uncharacterized protein PV07_04207 [Cladophialophora immunda]|uniref:Transcription factor domain-containing protein n=1 Tax=Cladophialophora immunda TaxID=569365 RepID=A0A0D2CN61_9EURO|nr:uncharacterized protein PV07_04207 [Cladophialophora immunda]KIW32678.1 hypothetical protein PV07_04207 [Cladophialophora immunda]
MGGQRWLPLGVRIRESISDQKITETDYFWQRDEPTSDISVSPLKLFVDLDTFMDEQVAQSPSHLPTTVFQSLGRDEQQIDRCLRSALHAYIARWLPLFLRTESGARHSVPPLDEISRSCWRTARKDMLKAINLPSYRSVLALYLFGQTPVPLGISPEEELDGISGVVCSKTALLHVQQLRERQRCCQFNGSGFSAWSDASPDAHDKNPTAAAAASPTTHLTEAYLNLESRAYWATVTWDTSDSMTLNFRSTLSSGLKGACTEPVWQLARGFLVGWFHDRTHAWRRPGFRVSSDVAPQITSAASVCTIYTWRTIASLKEALREGVDEAGVQVGWAALLDAVDVFTTTVRPILRNCERQLHFLGQVDRLHWYEIVLLYHLGILILADALEAAHRSDLLRQLEALSLAAEHECFNVLKFGLESTYTLTASRPHQRQQQQPSSDSATETELPAQSSLRVSFVAIDPYPQHVVAAVMLMGKAFLRQYSQGSITHEAYCHLAATLRDALCQLPQNSKAVQSARENLQKLSAGYDSASEPPHALSP